MDDATTDSNETAQKGLGGMFGVLGLIGVAIGAADLNSRLNATLFSGLGIALVGGMNLVPADRKGLRYTLGAVGLAACGAGLVVAFL